MAKMLSLLSGVIRAVGDGRYEAYIIPPNKANHASFIEQLPDGQLTLAWFSGTKEGADKCSIVVAHLPPNGTQVTSANFDRLISWLVTITFVATF